MSLFSCTAGVARKTLNTLVHCLHGSLPALMCWGIPKVTSCLQPAMCSFPSCPFSPWPLSPTVDNGSPPSLWHFATVTHIIVAPFAHDRPPSSWRILATCAHGRPLTGFSQIFSPVLDRLLARMKAQTLLLDAIPVVKALRTLVAVGEGAVGTATPIGALVLCRDDFLPNSQRGRQLEYESFLGAFLRPTVVPDMGMVRCPSCAF